MTSRRPPQKGVAEQGGGIQLEKFRDGANTGRAGDGITPLPGEDGGLTDPKGLGDIALRELDGLASGPELLSERNDGHESTNSSELSQKQEPGFLSAISPHAHMPYVEEEIWPQVVPTDEWRVAARNAREEAGLTQKELAKKIGFTQNAISKIESLKGNRRERSTAVFPICLALGIAPPTTVFGDPLMQRFAAVGYQLRQLQPGHFENEVKQLENLLVTLRRVMSNSGGKFPDDGSV